MRYLAPLLLLLLLAAAQGCAGPATLGAHAILPAQTVDTKEAWIYMVSEEKAHTGVYRCYDSQQAPVCIKAKLVER